MEVFPSVYMSSLNDLIPLLGFNSYLYANGSQINIFSLDLTHELQTYLASVFGWPIDVANTAPNCAPGVPNLCHLQSQLLFSHKSNSILLKAQVKTLEFFITLL